jgi:hypothetical protein
MRYWRVITKAMMMFKKIYSDSVKTKLNEREAILAQMQENMKMQNEVAKGWILKAGKKLFISLFTDQTLNLDFM